ncbi:hypothetical protein EVAR_39162_1 [Eumeta japonica]|uniref:Mariner Mos1 transposase n=1 Tax=Eumeta variegata TaxID=151549 RepID=A0A4C1X5N1_EUMVA|nr:hypothetical protein EVAR_39162_1 [Eumeta japonica]
MYGSESWVWQKKRESRINGVEMRSLHIICRVCLKDRSRNSDVRKRCDLKEDVVSRGERDMVRWFTAVMERSGWVALENPKQTILVVYQKKGPNFKHLKPMSLHERIDGYQRSKRDTKRSYWVEMYSLCLPFSEIDASSYHYKILPKK